MKYYFHAFKNYAVSDGRASRRELIWFFAIHYLFMMVMAFLDGFFGLYPELIPLNYGYLTLIYLFATACPAICVQVRRLHDVGKSGTWWMAGKIPFVSLYVLYLYLKRGDDFVNEYGVPVNRKSSSHMTKSDHTVEYNVPAIEADRTRFCRRCGERLIDGSKFCRKCGTEVVEVLQ